MKNNENELLNEYNKYSCHLGNYYPFNVNGQLYLNMSDAVDHCEQKEIDLSAIIMILTNSYIIGDRTLVKNIKRLSWLTDYDSPDSNYNLSCSLPRHQMNVDTPINIANNLKLLLKEELIKYLEGKKKIGVFLSGGLDSRIVAGLLKELQNEHVYLGEVVTITWGLENSRDVIYSKEISKRFNWEFYHLKLTPEQLKNNIYTTGIMGAEFSPYHLHAMPEVPNIKGIEAVIAGSYGDSVGRAEFSGKHISNIRNQYTNIKNPFGIIRNDVFKKFKDKIIEDAFEYKKYISRDATYQYREIEQELHYMRRKLSACMNIIGQSVPVYQLFTSPNVFGYMWSLSPQVRNDEVYKQIISTLPEKLKNIPWARDGKTINGDNGIALDGTKEHHRYGMWIRNELYDEVVSLVLSEDLLNLNIFNKKALVRLIRVWKKQNTITVNVLDEIISWLASLAIFVKTYKLSNSFESCNSIVDSYNSIAGPAHAEAFLKIRGLIRE